MTKKEKIKGLYKLKQHLMNNPIELCGHKSLPTTLIDYSIEALEQELRWIPVSERLPELDENQDKKLWEQKVLITGYLAFDDKKELFVSEAFIDDVINNSVYDTIVTAWMPLPEPYKTESEDNE